MCSSVFVLFYVLGLGLRIRLYSSVLVTRPYVPTFRVLSLQYLQHLGVYVFCVFRPGPPHLFVQGSVLVLFSSHSSLQLRIGLFYKSSSPFLHLSSGLRITSWFSHSIRLVFHTLTHTIDFVLSIGFVRLLRSSGSRSHTGFVSLASLFGFSQYFASWDLFRLVSRTLAASVSCFRFHWFALFVSFVCFSQYWLRLSGSRAIGFVVGFLQYWLCTFVSRSISISGPFFWFSQGWFLRPCFRHHTRALLASCSS